MASRSGALGRTVLGLMGLVLAVWGASAVLVLLWGRRDEARPADAIVVLGAAQYAGRPSPVLKARLDHAVGLYRRGLAPRVVLTGGVGEGDTTSEAAVGRRYARKAGVPDSSLLAEEYGRTTTESLYAVAELLQQTERPRVILVSDPFHMLRLRIIAGRLGMTAYTSPTPTSPIERSEEQRWSYVLSESIKVPLTLVFGRWTDQRLAPEAVP